MAWIEQINTGFFITTGDGQQYQPNWMNANLSKEYNVAEFDFPNIQGTLVTRQTSKGSRFNLEIYFQGEDCLDVAKAFRVSADDKRAWNISHPLYGDLIVQPIGLSFDDSKFNVSKVTGTVVETITEEAPRGSVAPVDKIASDKEDLNAVFEESFVNDVEPGTSEINSITDNIFQSYSKSIGKVKDALQAEEYFNLYNTANAVVLDATQEPLEAIRAAQTFLNYPGIFLDTVENRISLLTTQFNTLRNSVVNATDYGLKKIYENNAAMLLSTMCVATSTPLSDSDYGNRETVLRIAEIVLDNLDNYITDVSSLQSENGGSVGAYLPDSESLTSLTDLVGFTVSNLFNIALNARQQRTVILEEDSNAIILTHRFLGLDQQDVNINEFININNIGINEMLQIKKGRQIIYFV